jgi:hypothetical protein
MIWDRDCEIWKKLDSIERLLKDKAQTEKKRNSIEENKEQILLMWRSKILGDFEG